MKAAERMNNQQQQQQHQFYNQPPPGYSPPGQEPPVHLRQPLGSNSFQQPLPTLSAPGIGIMAPQPQQQQQQQQPMIIYANTLAQVQFGPYPMRFTCPNCNAHVMTETNSTPGILTFILCFLTSSMCCCLFPFCIRQCKDIEHRCPNCHHKLGLYKRI